MTDGEKQEVLHLLEAHERTIEICRACAQTTRDLASQITRGSPPDAAELTSTIDAAERVLDDLARIEITIGHMKAAL